jgi:hypothetical protein
MSTTAERRHALDTLDTRLTQNGGRDWSWSVNHGQSFSLLRSGIVPLTSPDAEPSERVRVPPPPRVLRGDREHRWRCASPDVAVVDFARPFDRVADPDAWGLRPCPQLQVLRAVVVSDAVDVVDRLSIHQEPAEEFFGHDDVLEHIALAGTRMIRDAHERVAGLVPCAASLPVAIGFPDVGTAGGTGHRLDLLLVAARAEVPGSARRATPVAAGRLEEPSALGALPLRHSS